MNEEQLEALLNYIDTRIDEKVNDKLDRGSLGDRTAVYEARAELDASVRRSHRNRPDDQ